MTTPEDVHEGILENDDFRELLETADEPTIATGIRTAIQFLGDSSEMNEQYECEELSIQEVGWLKLAWEAHHEQEQYQTVATDQ